MTLPALAVVEYTDPMCPWAWGSEPTFRCLREAVAGARWRRVYGILFDDTDDPAPDPAAETAWYHSHLQEIAGHTGAPWPAVLERVALSSRPSSLAARAAEWQGGTIADRVLRRLRETVFILGSPADTPQRVLSAVRGVPDLDVAALAAEMTSERTAAQAERDWAETRRPPAEIRRLDAPGPHGGRAKPIDGGHRYALPTLLFEGPHGRRVVPGWRPLTEYLAAAEQVAPGSTTGPPRPDPLRHYRSLTTPEAHLLLGGAPPARAAIEVPTPGGPLWLDPDEATTHPATRQG
jgi:protein-disulfide isomerase-like protein with CxxC motif